MVIRWCNDLYFVLYFLFYFGISVILIDVCFASCVFMPCYLLLSHTFCTWPVISSGSWIFLTCNPKHAWEPPSRGMMVHLRYVAPFWLFGLSDVSCSHSLCHWALQGGVCYNELGCCGMGEMIPHLWLCNWFLAALSHLFGQPVMSWEAARTLGQLRQANHHVFNHVTGFLTLAVGSQWNDKTLLDFLCGVSN